MTASLPWGATIPLRPFFGILAVAPPPEYGPCSSVEPREFGGNLDNKEFVAGTSLYLPVFVPGANFSCGDGHAVQGDGEVCLTALETCLTGTFEFVLHKRKTARDAARRHARRISSPWGSIPTSTTPPSRRCAT